MFQDSKWASFVRAHRLAQNLNQGEFAKALGVSQQTVSRWESGGQIPDASIQNRLKEQLRSTALGSTDSWRHRVGHSSGHEVLIDRNLTVLAASTNAARLLGGASGQVDGMSFPDLLPDTEIPAAPMGLSSIRQLRDLGFFDGLIRSIRLDMEWHLKSGSCACKTDVWPILTSEQVIIGQFSGMPHPINPDSSGFKGVRVKQVDVRLNKDMQDE